MYQGKHIAILGLGIAGLHSAHALMDMGAVVYAWDDNENSRHTAQQQNIPIVDILQMDTSLLDCMVVSPGISDSHPICIHAHMHDIPIIGEVKLRYDMSPNSTYVGITGTNGKSTTTALVAHVLETLGVKHAVGGNFGMPAISLGDLGDDGVYVLEMSSYMLSRVSGMKFDVACLLNITPDHLVWHGSMDAYFQAKMHIFDNMETGAIVCIDDDWGQKAVNMLDGDVRTVSYQDAEETLYLKGCHNRQNIAVCVAICEALGLQKDDILQACKTFKGLNHRQQFVCAYDGVDFINDSKATNVQSSLTAITCYNDIYWIAGGREKTGGYDDMIPHLNRISHAYLIGEGTENIGKFLREHNVPYSLSGTMDVAVQGAFKDAQSTQGVVLLSPACASWDQFDSFAHRGDVFCNCVKSLVDKKGEQVC